LDNLFPIIEDDVVPNNYGALLSVMDQKYQANLHEWNQNNQMGETDVSTLASLKEEGDQLVKLKCCERERLRKLAFKQGINLNQMYSRPPKDNISFKSYMENVSKIDQSYIDLIKDNKHNQFGVKIPAKITTDLKEKVYYDMLPLFTTIIGIMEKQQKEIEEGKLSRIQLYKNIRITK